MSSWIGVAVLAARIAQTSIGAQAGVAAEVPGASPSRLEAQVAAQRGGGGDRLEIDGQFSTILDVLPRREATELRSQIGLDLTFRPSDAWRMNFDASVEALAADRSGRVTDAIGRVREAWVEVAGRRGDLRAGFGRVIWGRLDEIQPSDVINPLDTARFLLDGRAEARRAVAFARARVFASESLSFEGVLVPAFRRGTFDELAEDSSPFNLTSDVLPAILGPVSTRVRHETPETNWSNISGGGRVSATIGSLDVAVAGYRGFDGFGIITFEPTIGAGAAVVGELVERYPRFTMVSTDFETVVGDWAIRGEVAAFIDKRLGSSTGFGSAKGRAIDAGFGFDRETGGNRIFGSVLWQRQWSDEDASVERENVSVIGSIERPFARERYRARAFAVVNPGDRSGFVRGLFVWNARDNVSVEASAGAFLGTGNDTLSRFKERDFAFGRIKFDF